VTDHRVGISIHNLPQVMEGDLDDFIEALVAEERNARLEGDGSPL
jgi:peptide chain release factor 1